MSKIEDLDNVNRLPDEDTEVFGVVTNMLGANRVKVRSLDGTDRVCRIPGKMQKSVWIREDDLVIIEPWEWQDEKGDVKYRYDNQEINELEENDIIQTEE